MGFIHDKRVLALEEAVNRLCEQLEAEQLQNRRLLELVEELGKRQGEQSELMQTGFRKQMEESVRCISTSTDTVLADVRGMLETAASAVQSTMSKQINEGFERLNSGLIELSNSQGTLANATDIIGERLQIGEKLQEDLAQQQNKTQSELKKLIEKVSKDAFDGNCSLRSLLEEKSQNLESLSYENAGSLSLIEESIRLLIVNMVIGEMKAE